MGATVVIIGFISLVGLAVLYVVVGIGISFLREIEKDPFSLRKLFFIWLGVTVYIVFVIFVGFPRIGEGGPPVTTAIDALIVIFTVIGLAAFIALTFMSFGLGPFLVIPLLVAFPFYAIARLTKFIPDKDVGKLSYF